MSTNHNIDNAEFNALMSIDHTANCLETPDELCLFSRRKNVMFEDYFNKGLGQWVAEGPPGTIIRVESDGVLLDPRNAQHRPGMGVEGLNLWCKVSLVGNWRMSFDLEPIAPVVGDNKKCNLLFMFNCKYQDPTLDLLDYSFRRSGSYIWLHGKDGSLQHYEKALNTSIPLMDGYTITYYRMAPQSDKPYQLVARKNPGFHLLDRADQSAGDQWNYRHTVHIEKRDHRFFFYQGDKVVFSFEDTGEHGPPLTRGNWGFRTWCTAVRLYSVRVEPL